MVWRGRPPQTTARAPVDCGNGLEVRVELANGRNAVDGAQLAVAVLLSRVERKAFEPAAAVDR